MMVRRLLFFLFLGYAAFGTPAYPQDVDEGVLVRELLTRSGIESRIRSLPDLLETALKLSEPSFTSPQITLLRATVRDAFNPDSLMQLTYNYWSARSSVSSLQDALEWFDSPVGSKIARLETASLSPESLQSRLRFERTINKRWIGQRRRLLIERLDNNLERSSLLATFATSLVRSMWKSFTPEEAWDDNKMDEAILNVQREIRPKIRQATLAFHVFSYRTVRSDDLQKYNEFLESSRGRVYVRNLNGSLTAAFDAAAGRFAQTLASAISAGEKKE